MAWQTGQEMVVFVSLPLTGRDFSDGAFSNSIFYLKLLFVGNESLLHFCISLLELLNSCGS